MTGLLITNLLFIIYIYIICSFASQQRGKNIHQLNIKYRDIDIKQHSEVTTYLGYVPDKTIPGEPMALKVINKINGKLKFFYRKIDL